MITRTIRSVVSRNIFRGAALLSLFFVLTVLLAGDFVADSWLQLRPTLRFMELASLVGLLLLVAALVQYGDELIGRITKIGPVEFSGSEETADLDLLEQLAFDLERLRVVAPEGDLPPDLEDWPKDHRYAFENFDTQIVLRLGRSLGGPGDRRLAGAPNFRRALFQVGTLASGIGDWPRAADRLETLAEMTERVYVPGDVQFAIGVTYALWAEESPAEEQKDRNEEAVRSFNAAIGRDPGNKLAYFWLAYVQDELGQYPMAIASLDQALRLRPKWAAAKFNLAIAFAKLGRLERAHKCLASIADDDDEAERVFLYGLDDPDISPLLQDPTWGPPSRALLKWGRIRAGH